LTPGCLPRFFHDDRRTENGSWLDRWLGPPAPGRMFYPLNFRILTLGLYFSIAVSVAYHAHVFHPKLRQTGNADGFLSVLALTLRICLAWFAFTQAIHFLPCVSSRVARLYVQMSRCKRFSNLLFWYRPVYIFTSLTLSSLLSFGFSSLTTQIQDIELKYAVINVVVGAMGIFFAAWHHRLIMCTLDPPIKNRMAIQAIIDRLESCTYEHIVGHGKTVYPAACSICLAVWELLDRIKVTPCKHVFHEACAAS